MSQMNGKVKSIGAVYSFITDENGVDRYVPNWAIASSCRQYWKIGEEVVFEPINALDGKPQARNVRTLPPKPEGWLSDEQIVARVKALLAVPFPPLPKGQVCWIDGEGVHTGSVLELRDKELTCCVLKTAGAAFMDAALTDGRIVILSRTAARAVGFYHCADIANLANIGSRDLRVYYPQEARQKVGAAA
ncbi:MAG: hypothetical protein WC528_02920 [Patescibacteria group bacterium]